MAREIIFPGDNGGGGGVPPLPPLPHIHNPVQATTGPTIVEAVLVSVDNEAKATVATVAIGNDLPLQTGYAIPSSIGVTFQMATYSAGVLVAPPQGVAYYDNNITLTGGSFCYVDTVAKKVISIEQGNSIEAPANPSSLFQFIKHDGAYNSEGNFQNPAPIDTNQLLSNPDPTAAPSFSVGPTPFVYVGTGSGAYDATTTFTLNDSVAPLSGSYDPAWLYQIGLFAIANGAGTSPLAPPFANAAIKGHVSITANGEYSVVFHGLSAGTPYSCYVCFVDVPGHFSEAAIVGTTATNPTVINPGQISGLGGPNLVPDSDFHFANFNGSGIGSSDPYWNFYWIDGISFFIGAGGTSDVDGPENYCGIRPGDSTRNCTGQSEVITVTPGNSYTLSGYIDARTCSGNAPGWYITPTNWSPNQNSVIPYQSAMQTVGANGRVTAQWTCPTGVTQVTVGFASNDCTVNSSILVFGIPMLQEGLLGPYTPGPIVSGAVPTSPPPSGGSGGGAGTPAPSNPPIHIPPEPGGGVMRHPVMPWQVRNVINTDADGGGSTFQQKVIHGAHILDTGTNPTLGIWDPTNNVFDHTNAMSHGVQTAINPSGQGLLNLFPGSTLNTDGTLTNVDGKSTSTSYSISTTQPTLIFGEIQKGVTTSPAALILGNTTNGYGLELDASGNVVIGKWVAGTFTSLASVAYVNDTNPHSYRLTISNSGGTNYVEGTIDQHALAATDTSLTLTTGTWPVTVYTGGSVGKLSHYGFSSTQSHFGSLPVTVQNPLIPPWDGGYADGSTLRSGLLYARHISGNSSTDTTPITQDKIADGTTYNRVKATELASGTVKQLNDGTNVRTAAQVGGVITSGGSLDVAPTAGVTGNLPFVNHAPAFQNAIDSSSNLLITNFPGQTKRMQSGTYAGWENLLDDVVDSQAYHISPTVGNDWLWAEWYVVNTASINSVIVGTSFGFVDNAGNSLKVDLYSTGGSLFYNSTGGYTGATANPFFNTTATPQPHYVRVGVTAAAGLQTRLVLYVDNIKCFDALANVSFIGNTPLRPTLGADNPTYVYIKSYSTNTGQTAYEQHAIPLQNRGAGMHVSCAGQMPYIDSSNVLHFPSNVIWFRLDSSYCRIDAGTTVAVAAWDAVYFPWVSQGTSTPTAIPYNSSTYHNIFDQTDGGNYEIAGYVNADSGQLLFHCPWLNASHFSGMQNTLDVNGNMKSSTNMNDIASTPPSAGMTVTPSYSATSSSIQYSIPSYTWYRSDGSSFTVPAATSTNFGGLTAGATYYTTIAYDIATNTVSFTRPSTTPPTPAEYISALYDGVVSIYIAYEASTPASGSSSGGGTTNTPPRQLCPEIHQAIETLERGIVEAGTLLVGEHLRDPFNGWNRIESVEIQVSGIFEVATHENEVVAVRDCGMGNFAAINCERHRYVLPSVAKVNDSHRIMLANGEWEYVRNLKPGQRIMPLEGDLHGQIGHNLSF